MRKEHGKMRALEIKSRKYFTEPNEVYLYILYINITYTFDFKSEGFGLDSRKSTKSVKTLINIFSYTSVRWQLTKLI